MANEDYKPLNEVAALIGVKKRTLELRIKGGKWPALPSRVIRDVLCVDPNEAYAHLVRYGSRKPAGLHRPPGGESETNSQTPAVAVDQEIKDALGGIEPASIDPHELAWKLLCAGVDNDKIKTAVAVARELRGKKDSALKAGKSLPPDDVVRMLRGLGELFVDEIMAGEERCAAELLKIIRGRMGIDLGAKHPDASIMLRGVLREVLGESVIKALKARIEADVSGVQALEFHA